MRRSVLEIFALTAMVGSISGLWAATQPQAASGSLLEYVPADTPYVFTNFEPLPEPFLAKLRSSTAAIWEAYQESLRRAAAEAEAEAEEAKEEGADAEKSAEMLESLSQYLSWEGLQSLGVGFKRHMAVYGVSLQPVIRWELDDPGAFAAAIAGIEEAHGISVPKGSLQGQDYWYHKSKEGTLYYAIVGDSLVASVLPAGLEADLLPIVFGLKKPSRSLAESGRLQQLAQKHGYLPYGAGYIDVRRIAEILLGESSDEYTKLLETLAPGGLKISEVCKKEALQLAEAWPIFHGGYTELTPSHMSFKGVLQTSPGLAEQLQGLVSEAPDVGTVDDGIIALGVALKLSALRPFLASQAASLRDDPFECENLSSLPQLFEQLEAGLAGAPPPVFALGLQGVRLLVQSVDLDPVTSNPRDLRGYVILQTDNPSAVAQMLQAMAPGLAELNLEPNGEPVAVPAGVLPPFIAEPHLVMTEDALAVSVGQGNVESLQKALRAEKAPSPLLSITYRVSELMQFVRRQMEAEAAKSNDPDKAAETELTLKILRAYDALKSVSLDFGFSDGGVVISQTVELN